jgi:hypothetical protein
VTFTQYIEDNVIVPNNAANVTYDPAGTGAVSRTVQAKLRDVVSVKDFGAVGDGVTDDTAAIQAAFEVSGTIVFPAPGAYNISNTVILDTGTTGLFFENGAYLNYTGAATKPALVIGATGVQTSSLSFIGVDVRTSVSHSYTDEDFAGVRIIRATHNNFDIRKAENFTVNLQLWGSATQGIAYNTFTVGTLRNALVHLDINSRIASGFINENLFIGGRYGNSTGYSGSLNSYGFRFRAEAGAYTQNNNNVCLKPCFELLDGNLGVQRIPVYIDNAGRFNTFIKIRAETGRGPVLYASGSNGANTNTVDIGYVSGSFLTIPAEESGTSAYANQVINNAEPLVNPGSTWFSGDLLNPAFGVTTSNIAIPKFLMFSSSSSTGGYSGGGAVFADSVSLTGGQGIGVFVDTTEYKNLVVQTDTLRNRNGRIGVICFDSSGNLLNNSGVNHPYAIGPGIGGTAAFGYIYRTGSDASNRAVFRLHADVAYVSVVISGGSNPVDIRSFSITGLNYSLDARPLHVYTGLSQYDAQRYAAADPDGARNGGFCAIGTFIWNSAAASGQPIGWICTTAGFNAKNWAASTAFAVGQMVNNDTGKVYKCVTAGTSASSGGPTGTGTGISDGTVTWDYYGVVPVFTAGPNAA